MIYFYRIYRVIEESQSSTNENGQFSEEDQNKVFLEGQLRNHV